MNRRVLVFTTLPAIMILACVYITQPFKIDTDQPSFTPLSAEEKYVCNVQIVITGIDEIDLHNGLKLVYVRIGIENHGNLWVKIISPDDSYDTQTEKSVFVTTQDGSNYGFLSDNYSDVPTELPPDISSSFYLTNRGVILSPLIPPGFSIQGQSRFVSIFQFGKPFYYGFAFEMPTAQVPKTITFSNTWSTCTAPPEVTIFSQNELNGAINLSEDVSEIRALPSLDSYPDLVGSVLELPFVEASIEFTGITRDGNTVNIYFDYTSGLGHGDYPNFQGYLLGDGLMAFCTVSTWDDCYFAGSTYELTQGQEAFSFFVPEDENILAFVYVYDGESDFNKVYKIDPQSINN